MAKIILPFLCEPLITAGCSKLSSTLCARAIRNHAKTRLIERRPRLYLKPLEAMYSLKFWERIRYYLWCVLAGIASVVVGFEMYVIIAMATGNIRRSTMSQCFQCLNVSSRAWSQPGRMTTITSIMLLNAIEYVAYSPIGLIPPSLSGHHRQYRGTMHFVDVGVVVCLHDVDTHLILCRSS